MLWRGPSARGTFEETFLAISRYADILADKRLLRIRFSDMLDESYYPNA
jgi:hypothetical protein